jgi:hypothetical protein
MPGTPKHQFTYDYWAAAVKLVTAQGTKVGQAAPKLGLSMQPYASCVARAREGKLTSVDVHRMLPVPNDKPKSVAYSANRPLLGRSVRSERTTA